MDFKDLLRKFSTLFDDAVVEPLSRFFFGLSPEGKYVLFALLVGAIVTGVMIGRYRATHVSRANRYQNASEELVSRVIRGEFGLPDYHLMNHVTLRMEDGTTQIDHILVSRFGVFVIETKHYKGWIFANANHKTWTQVLYRLKYKFQNPIHQNMRHVRAVHDLLDFIPANAVRSLVVFTGSGEFKTKVPYGVYRMPGLIDFLRRQTDELISPDHMQFCVGRLETARLEISGETDIEHIQSLERRHAR